MRQKTIYSQDPNDPDFIWQKQRSDFYKHFTNQISVCSCIAYCDCYLHETISILFVQNKYIKNNQEIISKLVLPGGKRDIAGQGRAKFKSTDESCWEAMKGEFKEETNIDITPFCKGFCPYFNQRVGDKNIRTYFIKIHCQQISNLDYSRFRLYESFRRTWIDFETIISDFMSIKNNKHKMKISPTMIQTIKLFTTKFTKYILQLDKKQIYDLDKSFKLLTLFSFINNNIYKYKYTLFNQIKSIKLNTFKRPINTKYNTYKKQYNDNAILEKQQLQNNSQENQSINKCDTYILVENKLVKQDNQLNEQSNQQNQFTIHDNQDTIHDNQEQFTKLNNNFNNNAISHTHLLNHTNESNKDNLDLQLTLDYLVRKYISDSFVDDVLPSQSYCLISFQKNKTCIDSLRFLQKNEQKPSSKPIDSSQTSFALLDHLF